MKYVTIKSLLLFISLVISTLLLQSCTDCITCKECEWEEMNQPDSQVTKICKNDFSSDQAWEEFKNVASRYCECE